MAAELSAGGGSSTASWAVHGQCERFRETDPLITHTSRRALAKLLGHPDTTAGIPQSRWMRAMTFERLCHEPAFAGEVAARVAGWSGELPRPRDVTLANCHVATSTTLAELVKACDRSRSGSATLLHSLAVPYPGFDPDAVTPVKPDLAVVTAGQRGPVLIVGDVKDYERVRSRIDDARLLKGFLQVAMGAFAFEEWKSLPAELAVSEFGFLAVPRSVFLQPAIEVELLDDYRDEIVSQWELRTTRDRDNDDGDISNRVRKLHAEFRPDSCRSCPLFNFCLSELRGSDDPISLLTEIGVRANERHALLPMLDGSAPHDGARPRTVAQVRATLTGQAQGTGQRRIDPAGLPGTVNVVAVKSDAAALGFYGLGLQRVTAAGARPWAFTTFDDPQSPETRRRVMNLLGVELERAAKENLKAADGGSQDPIHVIVPDAATADLLTSTADQLAGQELNRLRWVRDQQMGRPLLTYNGEPATMPRALEGARRTAVSFLLEQDRARMLKVRTPVVDLTSVLRRHFVPGGAEFEASRLDFLVEWAEADGADHRVISDDVADRLHTPGARLGNASSDAIHLAQSDARRGDEDAKARFVELVTTELQYRADVIDRALAVLTTVPDSKLRPAYRSLEGDAQRVWRRRKDLRASDLVRFGRTYQWWRNQLVDLISQDDKCAAQLWALTNPLRAAEQASDAGDRTVTWATVTGVGPIVLNVASRRFDVGDRVLLLAVDDHPWAERDEVTIKLQKGSIRINGACIGTLEQTLMTAGANDRLFEWRPGVVPDVHVGDRLVIARLDWFEPLQGNKSFNVKRPNQDNQAAPKDTCTESSYAQDSEAHKWCCRPHEAVEAEAADDIALRRSRRELNPEVWPPVRDDDGFEVTPNGKPTADDVAVPVTPVPEEVTVDELE